MPSAPTRPDRRRWFRAGVVALLPALAIGTLTAVTAPAAQAAATVQTVPVSIGNVQANLSPALVGSRTRNFTASDPAVAVLDTGVSTHSDLNVAGAIDCMSGTPVTKALGPSTDIDGHGTSVSGVIAAIDDTKGTVGVAPGARIFSIQILDGNHRGTAAGAACALNWLNANAAANNIKVVNMSLALSTTNADDGNCGRTNGDVVHQLVCTLVGKGLVFSVSGGNATVGHTIDFANLIPAAYDEVLTAVNMSDYNGRTTTGTPPAGCTAKQPDDTYYDTADFAVSAADAAHTIAAVGSCVWSTKKGNSYAYAPPGSSISAAVISGVALQCFRSGGACAGKSGAQARAIILNQAAASAGRGHTYVGDPLHPVAGKYFGYLASTVPAAVGSAGNYTPVTATRVLDTRIGSGARKGVVVSGHALYLKVPGAAGVPRSGVQAVTLNLTAVSPSGSGDVVVYPHGLAEPAVSNLSFAAGTSRSNLVTAKVGADGLVVVAVHGAASVSTNLVADVVGWYANGSATNGTGRNGLNGVVVNNGGFQAVNPVRIVDTRRGLGTATAAIKPNATIAVQVLGKGGTPIFGPSAAVMNVTALGATASGSLSLFADNGTGSRNPSVSTVSFVRAQNTGNAVVVPTGKAGAIRIRNNSSGTVHVLIDLNGYYVAGSGVQSGTFRTISPARFIDTTTGVGAPRGAVAARASIYTGVTGRNSVPSSGVGSIAANYTVINAGAAGALVAYPTGTSVPNVVNVSFQPHQTTVGAGVTRLSNGRVSLYNGSAGGAYLLMDVFGYFLA